MKLMKHITIALVLCAIPAVAFGQTVTCEDCTHVVSVFQGNGGLIAAADGAEMVTYVTTCEGVTQSGELTPDADGMVSMSFQDAEVACHDYEDGGDFMLGPVMDGGWFWITGETNSAVGSLVDMAVLDNDTGRSDRCGRQRHLYGRQGRRPAPAHLGPYGCFLPTILPEAPTPDAAVCGPRYSAVARAFSLQATSSCMLGGGGSKIRLTGRGQYGGQRASHERHGDPRRCRRR